MFQIFGGVDTTGNTLAYLLYVLSVNPEKQEVLRKEISEQVGMEGNVTSEALGKMPYLK